MGRGDGFEFELGHGTILVGYSPFRKSVCLTLVKTSSHRTVAYFRDEADAVEFIEHVTGSFVEFKESR